MRMDAHIHFPSWGADPLCEKEGWRTTLVRGLPTIERNHGQGLDTITINWKIPRLTIQRCHLHQA